MENLKINRVWVTNLCDTDDNTGKFFRNLVQGEPKATEKYTVEELKEMGVIGFYEYK